MTENTPETLSEFKDWKKNIVYFLASQNISLFGSSLVQFAIIWYITLETKSGSMMMLSTIASFLPQILVSFFAGVWADRYNRKNIIMMADGAIAFSTLILALIFLSGYKAMWLVLIVSAVRSFGSGIQMPAVNALLPQLVPTDQLMRVNGINGSLQSLMFLISPAISGMLFSLVGLEATLFVDVTTAILAILIMLKLPVSLHQRAQEKQETSHLEDFKEGFRYVIGHRFIRSLFVFYAVFMFMVVPAAILSPLMVARTFGPEVWKLTANEMLFSAGTLLGGVFVAAWGGFKKKIYTISASSVAFGLLTIAMGLSKVFWIYLGVIFVTGIFIPFFNSASMVLFQEHVEESMLGRVFSFNQIISAGAFPLGMMVFGPLADIVAVETLFIGSGIILTLQGVLIVFNKSLMADSPT